MLRSRIGKYLDKLTSLLGALPNTPPLVLAEDLELILLDRWYSIIDMDLPFPIGSGTELEGKELPTCNSNTNTYKVHFTE